MRGSKVGIFITWIVLVLCLPGCFDGRSTKSISNEITPTQGKYIVNGNGQINPVQSETGNTAGNIINSGRVLKTGDWIVYSDLEQKLLYKMKEDGTEKTILAHDDAISINAMDNWIYYTTSKAPREIKKVSLNGEGNATIVSSGNNVRIFNIVGHTIYFTDESKEGDQFYQQNIDGRNKLKRSDHCCQFMNISNKYVYYRYNGIRKMDLENDESTQLSNDNANPLIVVDEWIYYINLSDRKIYKMKNDGTKRTKLLDTPLSGLGLNVSGDWIYFSIDKMFYRMKTDGTEVTQINELFPSEINVVGGWIYFQGMNKDQVGEGPFFRMKEDGTRLEQLSNR